MISIKFVYRLKLNADHQRTLVFIFFSLLRMQQLNAKINVLIDAVVNEKAFPYGEFSSAETDVAAPELPPHQHAPRCTRSRSRSRAATTPSGSSLHAARDQAPGRARAPPPKTWPKLPPHIVRRLTARGYSVWTTLDGVTTIKVGRGMATTTASSGSSIENSIDLGDGTWLV